MCVDGCFDALSVSSVSMLDLNRMHIDNSDFFIEVFYPVEIFVPLLLHNKLLLAAEVSFNPICSSVSFRIKCCRFNNNFCMWYVLLYITLAIFGCAGYFVWTCTCAIKHAS